MVVKILRVIKIIIAVSGALLLADGLVVTLTGNLNLGVILTALTGAAVLCYGIFFEKVNRPGPLRWLRNAGFAAVLFIVGMAVFLGSYGSADNVTYDEDVVIVLGAGVHGDVPSRHLVQRLEKALLYHEKNPDALILVSGGQGAQESVTEAFAMSEYLIRRGVPKDKIIMEEAAASTYENFKFSLNIINKNYGARFGGEYKAAFITNDFHVYRAEKLAEKAGFKNITHMHANIDFYTYPQNYIRETLAVLKLWILD